MKKIFGIIFNFLFCFSLFAKEDVLYANVLQELDAQSVSQLDFKIMRMNLLLNDKYKGLKRFITISYFFDSYEDYFCVDTEFKANSTVPIYEVKQVMCYKDQLDSNLIVCEVFISEEYENFTVKNRVEKIKSIYQEILETAKSIIHPSFNDNYLKVIIQTEKSEINTNKNFSEIPFEDTSFLLTSKIQKEIWAIWKNGIPYYQDILFNDPKN